MEILDLNTVEFFKNYSFYLVGLYLVILLNFLPFYFKAEIFLSKDKR